MSNPREAAKELKELAQQKLVKFPKIWDESKLMQACGALVMTHRTADGFNIEGALQDLVEKYGQEEAPKNKRKRAKAAGETDDGENAEGKQEGGSPNKKKKTEVIAEERNRDVALAIKEMADIYFKNKDMRKGGVFSKAAKAIRECETFISCAKDAMALKGVGKGIAGYIQEMLDTGTITKLEELRAGMA